MCDPERMNCMKAKTMFNAVYRFPFLFQISRPQGEIKELDGDRVFEQQEF